MGAYTTEKSGENMTEEAVDDLRVGKGITNTCHEMYIRQKTRLGPESANFAFPIKDFVVEKKYFVLRPETVESYFLLYRTTGDIIYKGKPSSLLFMGKNFDYYFSKNRLGLSLQSILHVGVKLASMDCTT